MLARALQADIRVSKATVYNTLKLFVSCGLVREITVDANRVYYDSTATPHHHIYNIDTGEIMDVPEHDLALARYPELPPGTKPAGVDIVVKVRRDQ